MCTESFLLSVIEQPVLLGEFVFVLLMQLFMRRNGRMFVAGCVRCAIYRMTTDTKTALNRTVMVLIECQYRAEDGYFTEVTAKPRPKVIPFTPRYGNSSAGNVLKPVPNECNNVHIFSF